MDLKQRKHNSIKHKLDHTSYLLAFTRTYKCKGQECTEQLLSLVTSANVFSIIIQ